MRIVVLAVMSAIMTWLAFLGWSLLKAVWPAAWGDFSTVMPWIAGFCGLFVILFVALLLKVVSNTPRM
ncbi:MULTISPECIES: hypothetical protein [Herbaspirillum]|uniref:Uncharacterized protein n=2 Tax=Herbaspirillum huttiense TaxID=863372 RepID=A0AAJ2HDY0_9BURK|nr:MULTISPECIES: hypothetical protein [Herbaspirillum]MDR9836985.1 hypothetical protein [Herbaspirillum huttiense]